MSERCWKCGSEEVPQEPIVVCGATFRGFQMCLACGEADARSRGIDTSLAIKYLREYSERKQSERRDK